MTTILLLFLAAVLAGALNAVAGGGSFITLPSLLYAGVTPVAANATTTCGIWAGSLASAVGYRREISATKLMILLGVVSMIGGLLGAVLLVRTSDTSFMRLLPWLLLTAAATFTFGGRVRVGTEIQSAHGTTGNGAPFSLWRRDVVLLTALQFLISIYGGYFGGGMGIMMLATYALV